MSPYFPILMLCSFTVMVWLALRFGTFIAARGFPLPEAHSRLVAVDGLRGMLALAVVAHHFAIWVPISLGETSNWASPDAPILNQLGAGAVGLFFMASGLVFYPRIRSGILATDWLALYIGRIFRLLPLTAAAIFLVLVVIHLRTGAVPGLDDIYPLVLWLFGADLPALMGYWDSEWVVAGVIRTLWIEWQFYVLIVPLAAFMVEIARRLSCPVMVVPLTLLIVPFLLTSVLPELRTAVPLLFFLPAFAVGMLAGECRQDEAMKALLQQRTMTLVATVSLVFGATMFFIPHGPALPFFAVFFVCVACGNAFGGVLTSPGARVMGELSFAIYLLHGIVLNVVFLDLPNAATQVPMPVLVCGLLLVIPIVLVLAACAFIGIERPGIRYGKALVKGMRSAGKLRSVVAKGV